MNIFEQLEYAASRIKEDEAHGIETCLTVIQDSLRLEVRKSATGNKLYLTGFYTPEAKEEA